MTPPFFSSLLGIEHVLGQHPTKSGPNTKSYKEGSTVTLFGKPVSKVRFLATIPRFSVCDNAYRSRVERCEFSLGIGPCGRTVTGLWYHMDTGFLTILQECAVPKEGYAEVKEFIYLVSEITGRVEVTSI